MFNVTVKDTEPPHFTKCPSSKNLGCNPPEPECDTSSSNVAATDNCGTPTITCQETYSGDGGNCFHSKTFIYTATDSSGNTATCVQQVSWKEDTTAPVLTGCPPDQTVQCPNLAPARATVTAGAWA